jgi:hypothetical protein
MFSRILAEVNALTMIWKCFVYQTRPIKLYNSSSNNYFLETVYDYSMDISLSSSVDNQKIKYCIVTGFLIKYPKLILGCASLKA